MGLVPMDFDDIVTSTSVDLKTGVTKISFDAKKSDHTVWIRSTLQKSMTAGGWNELCVLPSGFRPSNILYTLAVNSTDDEAIEMKIEADGTVAVWPKTATGARNITINAVFFDI